MRQRNLMSLTGKEEAKSYELDFNAVERGNAFEDKPGGNRKKYL